MTATQTISTYLSARTDAQLVTLLDNAREGLVSWASPSHCLVGHNRPYQGDLLETRKQVEVSRAYRALSVVDDNRERQERLAELIEVEIAGRVNADTEPALAAGSVAG